MTKPTPNPPETEDLSLYAQQCALPPHIPSKMFAVTPDINTESLLVYACESLASASVMASDFATFLQGPQRNMLLGIQQVIMLADLAVNRALDNIDPQPTE